MEAMFWLALGAVAYSYVVYPLAMIAVGRRLGALRPVAARDDAQLPSVAVVVAAHNEEGHIEARIRNVLALDYPADRLRLYVGSDGSADRTVQLAERSAGERVRLFAFAERRGKASVLNDLVAAADEEIVVFTDANTEFERGAVKALVAHFADARVGAVSGELRLEAAASGDNQDGRYWRFETAIKVGESRLGGLLGANGGIYAIRRELYRPLPPDTIIDDFTIVMNVSAAGRAAVFEPAALAYEDAPPAIGDELARRVRIGIGNYQAFFRHPEYWQRGAWVRRFTYLSHKVLRWFTPHLLMAALLASVALAGRQPYAVLLQLQLAGYAVLAAGMLASRRVRLPRAAAVPVFVFALNVAFLAAFCRYVTRGSSGQWRRTQRA